MSSVFLSAVTQSAKTPVPPLKCIVHLISINEKRIYFTLPNTELPYGITLPNIGIKVAINKDFKIDIGYPKF
jgi:hypothetical protein